MCIYVHNRVTQRNTLRKQLRLLQSGQIPLSSVGWRNCSDSALELLRAGLSYEIIRRKRVRWRDVRFAVLVLLLLLLLLFLTLMNLYCLGCSPLSDILSDRIAKICSKLQNTH